MALCSAVGAAECVEGRVCCASEVGGVGVAGARGVCGAARVVRVVLGVACEPCGCVCCVSGRGLSCGVCRSVPSCGGVRRCVALRDAPWLCVGVRAWGGGRVCVCAWSTVRVGSVCVAWCARCAWVAGSCCECCVWLCVACGFVWEDGRVLGGLGSA